MKISTYTKTIAWVLMALVPQIADAKIATQNDLVGQTNKNLRSLQVQVNSAAPEAPEEEQEEAPKDPVVVEVWTSPEFDWDKATGEADGPNIAIFDALKEVVIGFNQYVVFHPHMYIHRGDDVCAFDDEGNPLESSAQKEVCDANCSNKYRYCAVPPTDTVHYQVTGRQILGEALRRVCIWKSYNNQPEQNWDNEHLYFDYLTNFHDSQCHAKNYDDQCITGAFTASQIDVDLIHSCTDDHGGPDTNLKNEPFEDEIKQATDTGIDFLSELPAVVINGEVQTVVTTDVLFSAICNLIPEESRPPDVCGGDVKETLGEDEDKQEEEEAKEELETEIAEDLGENAPSSAPSDVPEDANNEGQEGGNDAPGDVSEETIEQDESTLEKAEAEGAGVQPQERDQNRPVVEVWTTPMLDWNSGSFDGDGPNIELFDHLKEVVVGFGDRIEFTPQMYISSSTDVCVIDSDGKTRPLAEQKECADSNCSNHHRYCIAGPDDWKVTGESMVEESLRRLCVWELYGRNEDGEDDVLFFDYLAKFHDLKCDNTDYKDSCISTTFHSVAIGKDRVTSCMENSGGLTDDVDNEILKELAVVQKATFAYHDLRKEDLPILLIGGKPVDNSADATLDDIFHQICALFPDSDKPDVCSGDVEETLGEDEDKQEEETAKEELEEEIKEDLESGVPSGAPSIATSQAPTLATQSQAPSVATQLQAPSVSPTEKSEIEAPETTGMPPHDIDVEKSSPGGTWALDSTETKQGEDMTVPAATSGSKDDSFSQFDLKLVDAALENLNVLHRCEVDTSTLVTSLKAFGQADGNFKQQVEDVEAGIPMLMSHTCPHETGVQLLQDMQDFHLCSKFDLQELIETFPSTAVGVMMRCANAYSNMTKEEEEKGYIPEGCIRTIEAESVLGRGIFGLYLYPDTACPCFEKLHDAIPECTADVWPIPINGALVKVQSCLVGQYCQAIDGMCEENLGILDTCLPPKNTLAKDMRCGDIFDQCSDIYDHVPPMLTAAPLPDACVRVAEGSKFFGKHVVERYDTFRHQCGKNIELWEGHTPVAEFKAFITDGIKGIDTKSVPFRSGAAGGFLAGIVFTVAFIIVRNFFRWLCDCCSRCWSRCCRCCGRGTSKAKRPTTKDYATVDTNGDDLASEYRDEPDDE